MSIIKQDEKVYKDGRTKQAFASQCDIQKIMQRAQKTGAISHLAKHEAHYGDYDEFDFLEAQTQLAKAGQIFDDLPSEVRREFNNQPGEFFAYANDPENVGRLGELLPALAEPGRMNLAPIRTAATEAAGTPEAKGKETPTPEAAANEEKETVETEKD